MPGIGSVIYEIGFELDFEFHAAGLSRRQVKTFQKMFENVKILEFGDYIWNHFEMHSNKYKCTWYWISNS